MQSKTTLKKPIVYLQSKIEQKKKNKSQLFWVIFEIMALHRLFLWQLYDLSYKNV